MQLTEKTSEVFNYIKENGGRVSIDEISQVLNRPPRSINASVNDLQKKGLITREKVLPEGEEKEIVYVVITEIGNSFILADSIE